MAIVALCPRHDCEYDELTIPAMLTELKDDQYMIGATCLSSLSLDPRINFYSQNVYLAA